MPDTKTLRVAGGGERWRLEGRWRPTDLDLCNDYLAYLADRRYSPASVRAYAFDLLRFAPWLAGEGLGWMRLVLTCCCSTGRRAARASTTT